MLDIRAVAYIAPASEVDFASVPLTVRIANVADETGLVTGRFRVYNTTTGTLIHTSETVPISLPASELADISALTDFDPPAPLDDTYLVVFDGRATNSLVPVGIGIFLGAFHFDVKPMRMGPAPVVHHATHEEGGADPIETADLGTTELDPNLALMPDGAGGVLWSTPAGAAHNRQHSITDSADHTSTATANQLLMANANGLPVDASNTNTEVSSAVSLKHAQAHTLTSHSTRTHSELTSIGASDHHSNASDPTSDQKAALAGTSGTPADGNRYVTNADSRNSDARTPTSHIHAARAVGTTSSPTPTPNADTTDLYYLTAQAEAATFGAPSGTPGNGQKLMIRIFDNGTARVLTWNSIYAARGAALPSTTVLGKYMYLGFVYNSAASKWDLVAVSNEA